MLRTRNEASFELRSLCKSGFLPTMNFQLYAVAIACWFRARQRMTRPFFLALFL